jgi:quercetin dioxygenase-like cupin family protein
MQDAAQDMTASSTAELPATAYPHHHHIFGSPGNGVPTGLLFDSRNYAMMSITHPPASQTPDLNTDADGDRVLILLDGDLALQIGESRFRLEPGDAVKIPRGVCFGRSRSHAGAHLVLIRAKAMRSFAMYR